MNASPDLGFWSGLFTTLALQTVCVVAVTAAVCHFVGSAQWRRTFWRACVVSLVLLPAGELTGIGRGLTEWTAKRFLSGGAERVAEVTPAGHRGAPDFVVTTSDVPATDQHGAGHSPASESTPVLWPGFVWLAGTTVFLLRLVIARALCFGFRLRNRSAPPGAAAAVASLARMMGINRRIRILESGGLNGPIAFGSLKPTIVLPEGFENDFSPKQREAMLAHELAHLAGRDPLWHSLTDAAVALLWWNPFVWWARQRLRVASEQCADEASVIVPRGPEALAESLVLLGGRLNRTESIAGLGVAGEFRSNLGRRVERLLNDRQRITWKPVKARSRLLTAFLAGAAVLALTFAGALFPGTGAAASDARPLGESIRSSWQQSASALTLASLERPGRVQRPTVASGTSTEPPADRSGEGASGRPVDSEATARQVEVSAHFIELSNSADIRMWLLEFGSDFEIVDIGSELTDHDGASLEGIPNSFVRRLTGTVSTSDLVPGLREISRTTGTDLLSSPKVVVFSGRKASIQVVQEDPEGVPNGVITDVVPTVDEGRGVIRLTLTASVIEAVEEAPETGFRWPWRRGGAAGGSGQEEAGAERRYRVRQVSLSDFELPLGKSVVLHGVRGDAYERERDLYIFVTPRLVEEQGAVEEGTNFTEDR